MSETHPPTADPAGPPRSLLPAVLLVSLSLAWTLVLSLGFGAGAAGWLISRGTEPDALSEALPDLLYRPDVLGVFTLVQFAGLAAVVLATMRGTGLSLRSVLGARPGWTGWTAAAVGGFATLWFAAGVAELMLSLFPSLESESLLRLGRAFESGSPFARAVLTLAVVVGAPLVEELLFRGALWRALEGVLPSWAVLLGTSALFAAYHLDPLHSTTVFGTGLMLGWLRLATGSMLPCVLLHAVNNGAAAALLLTYGADGSEDISAVSFVGAALGLVGAGLLARWRAPIAGREDAV